MSSSTAATPTRQGIWLQMNTERIPYTFELRLQCALIERQDPASIFTLVATAADALEDQDTLAYATTSQMIGELQVLHNAFYSLMPNHQ